MSPAPTKTWDNETWSLIKWFQEQTSLPVGPFRLRDGVTVLNEALFYHGLRGDIELGPRGPRGITGALRSDLKDLRQVLENGTWP